MKSLMLSRKNAAFTVAELLIVIVVIGILASVTLVSYNGAQAKARDVSRKNDLEHVANALSTYRTDTGNFIEAGSGCGYNNDGYGWLTYEAGGGYTKSIATCLKESGHLTKTIKDPSGGNGTSLPASGYAYMKYHCGSGNAERAYLYAKLETVPQSSTATDGTCDATLDTSYGMNYFVVVE